MTITSLITFGGFIVLLVLQSRFPKRGFKNIGTSRFQHNILLFLLNLALFTVVPLSLISMASYADSQQFGLFNQFETLPFVVEILLCVVILDLAVYWQHVFSHRWEWLWKLHQVHHSDRQIEVTTAVRFHPIELIISLVYKGLIVLLLGASVTSVVIFEFMLIMGAAFSHSNWRLQSSFDKFLRLIIVTPDVHRVHHSVHRDEHDSNFGFFLIWWDMLFSTYTKEPKDTHSKMNIGLNYIKSAKACDTIGGMLLMPLKNLNTGEIDNEK